MSDTQEQPQDPNADPDLELDHAARREQANRDKTLEDTFPASDPPAMGGTTGPND